jgi:hypothetical protein
VLQSADLPTRVSIAQVRYGPEGGKPEDLIAMLERVLFALRQSKGVEYKESKS